jgi:hypothetical protein
MKNHLLISAVFLSLTFINARADGYSCQKITGQLSQLTPDSACHILLAQGNHFPDTTFIANIAPSAPNVCFSGQLTATLGNNSPIRGTSYSGITYNTGGQLTAASSIELYSGKVANARNTLGKIYTKDIVVIDSNTNNPGEILTMVDGSNTFNGGHGQLEITGNALYQAVNFTGMICVEKK